MTRLLAQVFFCADYVWNDSLMSLYAFTCVLTHIDCVLTLLGAGFPAAVSRKAMAWFCVSGFPPVFGKLWSGDPTGRGRKEGYKGVEGGESDKTAVFHSKFRTLSAN